MTDMLYQEYYCQATRILNNVIKKQSDKIEQTAKIVSDTIANNGIIYLFGCGHSHIITEDLFYRAGGLAPVCAILDSALMLHEGAVKSSCLERMTGLAEPLFRRYPITRNDMMIIFSTSGINSVPIEMAQCAHEKGAPVIAVVSQAYVADESRHPSGKKLHDCADIVLDNGVCHGDTSVEVGKSGVRVGPISTISGCMIAQCIMVQAEENLWARGIKPPVYVSGNMKGGMEKNQALIEEYRPRVRHL